MKKLSYLLLIAAITLQLEGKAQFLRAKVGIDIPMQYLVGLNYQQGKKFSFDLSAGIITSPWNNELYDVIRVPEKHKARKDFLQETTDGGWVLGTGANFNFGNWYAGVFGQRVILNASGTYKFILGSDLLQQELTEDEKTQLDLAIGLFGPFVNLNDEITLHTELYQLGLKIGRRFFFRNPRFEFRLEFAFSKNMYAKTTTNYDEGLVNNIIALDPGGQLSERLDFNKRIEEVDVFFRDYGYIPTINTGLTYLLFIPDKVKKEQEKLDLQKSAE